MYVAPVPVQALPSLTVTTTGNVPVWVGVPERTPVVANVRPLGSVLAVVKVVVPMVLLAVKLWLKGALTVPVVVAGLVTVMV